MPPTTRSQAAAAVARRRDLQARQGVLTRRHARTAAALRENVAPPAVRTRKNGRAAAVVKKTARANSKVIRELQMKVKSLEAEIERMKKAEINQAASSSRARRLRRDGDAAPITSLCDDLLLEILLRLPSLATLIHAACTCPAWRHAVVSSPDFRRRFRALHPPPLLGLFTTDRDSIVTGSPTFVPARPLGRDLGAAVRGGDFSLTSLAGGDWQVISSSCRLGNLLLYNWEDGSLAALNPLTRQPNERHLVPSNILGSYFAAALLSSSSEVSSSRVMLVDVDNAGNKMKASIFSMDTGVCEAATPWVDVPACPHQEDDYVPYGTAMQLNGSVHYVHENWGYIASIDTATLEFTIVELPPQCVSQSSFFSVGETHDGTTCLVYSDGLDVGVLMHTRDADGVQKWVLDRVVSMDAEPQRVLPAGQFDDQVCVLQAFAVRDGHVYLSTSVTLQDRYWYLSLCLETMKLEKLFQGAYGYNGIPYIMPWPRSLLVGT